MNQLPERLLEYLQQPSYQPIKPKALAKKLGVTKKKMSAFEKALDALVESKQARLSDSGRVQPASVRGALIGAVRKISSGDAFIVLQDPARSREFGDVFVDQHDLGDAQSGDEVVVRLTKRRRASGGRCGVVVEIVERAANVFVGTYFEDDDTGWVQVDGRDVMAPIWVGDPGAKGAQPGDKVVVEMLRFPTAAQSGEGVLTKVLGPRGAPGVDTQMVIHQFALPHEFSAAALHEARIEAENFREQDLTDREDLTELLTVTIDPVDARDFDDAISLERWENGHWHLGVHIADVAHFVQPGTELDREAALRGTSVYLPTLVIPMLPEVISNGLASLQSGKVRFTLSAFIEFSADGIPIGARFARSAIRVSRRFAYEDVLPLINASRESRDEIESLLHRMHELAMLLRRRRFARGALNLDLPEVKLQLDPQGAVIGAGQVVHDESHQIIEEFMLAANIAVATELNDRGLGFLRRVHADPSLPKMTALGEFLQLLGYPIKKVQSREDLQRVLDLARGRPEESAVQYALLRSLKQAEYSPADLGHYALAVEQYCHFTSPIRRYPDLLVHRLISGVLTGHPAQAGIGPEELVRQGRHCSLTERRAERAERALIVLKLLTYLQDRIGEEMDAVITGVDRYGFFCRGVELPAEGLVHISTLPGHDRYDFDRQAQSLISRGGGRTFRLGDRIRVKVAHVDVDRRELNFQWISSASTKVSSPAAAGPSARKKNGSASRRPKKGARRGRSRD